jgi:GNAT superfamily N-acetyltransferase
MNPSVPLSPEQIDIAAPRSDADWADAARLLTDYAEWLHYVSGYQDTEIVQEIEANPALLRSRYVTPNGAFVLARFAGNAVGIAAVKRMSCEIAEIKRVYLRPSARGLGLAQQLLETAIDAARRLRVKRLRLETHEEYMPAAVKLYTRRGFYEIPAYSDLADFVSGVKAMELEL